MITGCQSYAVKCNDNMVTRTGKRPLEVQIFTNERLSSTGMKPIDRIIGNVFDSLISLMTSSLSLHRA